MSQHRYFKIYGLYINYFNVNLYEDNLPVALIFPMAVTAFTETQTTKQHINRQP